jgi:hypothetical protein
MPLYKMIKHHRRHRFHKLPTKRGIATEVFGIKKGYATRYRFHGIVHHHGKKMRQRLGYRGNKVVEVAFVPYKKR